MFLAVNMGRKSTKSDCKLVLVDWFGFEQPYCFLKLGDDPMDEILLQAEPLLDWSLLPYFLLEDLLVGWLLPSFNVSHCLSALLSPENSEAWASLNSLLVLLDFFTDFEGVLSTFLAESSGHCGFDSSIPTFWWVQNKIVRIMLEVASSFTKYH